MTISERKHEWQEVSRVYLTDLNLNTMGTLQDKLDQLKRIHGEDARIETASYQNDASSMRSDLFHVPKTTTYFRVMKYLPVSSYVERLAEQEPQLSTATLLANRIPSFGKKKKK